MCKRRPPLARHPLLTTCLLAPLLLLPTSLEAGAAREDAFDTEELDCGMRRLLYRRAKALQPWRGVLLEAFDALELEALCGEERPVVVERPAPEHAPRGREVDARRFYVAGAGSDDDGRHDGSVERPFATIHHALTAARRVDKVGGAREIVLRGGVHFLNETLRLTVADSGLIITNEPGEEVWLSGGAVIPAGAEWRLAPEVGPETWVTDLPHMAEVPGLFSLHAGASSAGGRPRYDGSGHRRFTRARWPNGDAEIVQWGYASVGRYNFSLPAAAVEEWLKPKAGRPPSFRFANLSARGNPSGLIKNNSAVEEYNMWGVGFDGVCADVWEGDSYWCSNVSAGGWAEVDRECATSGKLQLPVGMVYNETYTEAYSCNFGDRREACATAPLGPRFSRWKNATGAIVHAWHSQSWAMHMFEVDSHDVARHSLKFSRGGQQGGRNWCRCDQCGYAGRWCTQHLVPAPTEIDTRLIGGDFMVENVLEELDVPGEWFFNRTSRQLFFRPNASSIDSLFAEPAGASYTIPVLKTLVSIVGSQAKPVRNVTIRGVGFRDAASTFMDAWGVPSGGDWALHRGGALFMEGVEDIDIDACTFSRLDGNAVFLSRYTRGVVVQRSEFAWIGDNAMATWGDTEGYDATARAQPRGSKVLHNYVHDIGIYEKQSSGWGQAKACLSELRGNIMFNMPRAAINFNDHLGGGNVVHHNLIWNTCRESGDHGPINTWDRMPFLTDVRGQPSFDPATTVIAKNFIVSNYGGSMAVDNDDGSSWFDISDNLFYMSEGFKMDYGGHGSGFHGNLLLVAPYSGMNCIGLDSFLKGNGDSYYNNTCVSGISAWGRSSGCGSPACFDATRSRQDMDRVGSVAQCDPAFTTLRSNRYYSPHGNASFGCGGEALSLLEVQRRFRNELGSTFAPLPRAETVLAWGEAMVERWSRSGRAGGVNTAGADIVRKEKANMYKRDAARGG